jgi:hypothetical protein
MIKKLWLGLATYFVVMVFAVGFTLAAVAMLLPGVIILRITLIDHRLQVEARQYRQFRTAQNLNRPPM